MHFKNTSNGIPAESTKAQCFHFNRKESLRYELKSKTIHFIFCLNADIIIHFNPHYQRTLPASQGFIIYNAQDGFNTEIVGLKNTRVVIFSLSFNALHHHFINAEDPLPNWPIFEQARNKERIYEQISLHPELSRLINDFSVEWQREPERPLVREGLFMQILGNILTPLTQEQSTCPYLKDQSHIYQIKLIKEYILSRLAAPPTLTELSKHFNINTLHLKNRFKMVYGLPVYQFILNAKLEQAHQLLHHHNYSVKEAAFTIGYQNPSQFISVYKKKYGKTPKQDLKSNFKKSVEI